MRLAITILALTASPAFAGSCRYGSFAGQSVESCDNGYVETHGPRGSRSYGIRNGGFDLTHKEIHEARQIRDAEDADPGTYAVNAGARVFRPRSR